MHGIWSILTEGKGTGKGAKTPTIENIKSKINVGLNLQSQNMHIIGWVAECMTWKRRNAKPYACEINEGELCVMKPVVSKLKI